MWITCPGALRGLSALSELPDISENAVLRAGNATGSLNLGWLVLPVKGRNGEWASVDTELGALGVPDHVKRTWAIISDKVFSHVVNSNLEVRTSVSIDPETGAAEGGALFTYEALPRGTVLVWQVTCRHPGHFRVGKSDVSAVADAGVVHSVVGEGHGYLEFLGIGGMGTRGMGRLRVLNAAAGEGGT